MPYNPGLTSPSFAPGRTCLHFSAEHCEGLEDLLLLEDVAIDFSLKDRNGQTALHFAASAGCPMAAYALAKACPDLCLAFNKAGKIPSDIAKEKNYLEVSTAPQLPGLLFTHTDVGRAKEPACICPGAADKFCGCK